MDQIISLPVEQPWNHDLDIDRLLQYEDERIHLERLAIDDEEEEVSY
jgi:hypothetical protein